MAAFKRISAPGDSAWWAMQWRAGEPCRAGEKRAATGLSAVLPAALLGNGLHDVTGLLAAGAVAAGAMAVAAAAPAAAAPALTSKEGEATCPGKSCAPWRLHGEKTSATERLCGVDCSAAEGLCMTTSRNGLMAGVCGDFKPIAQPGDRAGEAAGETSMVHLHGRCRKHPRAERCGAPVYGPDRNPRW